MAVVLQMQNSVFPTSAHFGGDSRTAYAMYVGEMALESHQLQLVLN